MPLRFLVDSFYPLDENGHTICSEDDDFDARIALFRSTHKDYVNITNVPLLTILMLHPHDWTNGHEEQYMEINQHIDCDCVYDNIDSDSEDEYGEPMTVEVMKATWRNTVVHTHLAIVFQLLNAGATFSNADPLLLTKIRERTLFKEWLPFLEHWSNLNAAGQNFSIWAFRNKLEAYRNNPATATLAKRLLCLNTKVFSIERQLAEKKDAYKLVWFRLVHEQIRPFSKVNVFALFFDLF